MNKSRTPSAASLVPLLLVLAACGSEQQPADAPYSDAMEKARGVEATLQQQKDNMDQALQEKEQPTAE